MAYSENVLDFFDCICAFFIRNVFKPLHWAMVSDVTAAFAGGRLDDEALDGAMQALTKAYWIAKEKNKKYTPKKYLKDTSADK